MERVVRNTLAPVVAIARAVSIPIPEEQPVIRKIYSVRLKE